MNRSLLNLIETSDDASIGSALVRLAKTAANVHQLETDRLANDPTASGCCSGLHGLAVDLHLLEESGR